MATNIETDLIVKAIAEGFDKVSADMSKLSKSADEIEKSTKRAEGGLTKMGLVLGNLVTNAVQQAGRAVVDFVKGSIELASNVEEAASKFQYVFGPAAEDAGKRLDEFGEAAGRSRYELREMAANIGAVLEPMIGSKDAAADMSVELTKLATDLASFNNVAESDALLALRSGMIGQMEPMLQFGVVLRAADVEARVLADGLAKTKGEITEAMRVQARYNIIMEQTATAQGDAERTSDSFANQQRALGAAFQELQVALGQELLPAMTELTAVTTGFVKSLNTITTTNQAKEGIEALTGNFDDYRKAVSLATDTGEFWYNRTVRDAKQAELYTEVLRLLQAGIEGTAEEIVDLAEASLAADIRAQGMNDAYEDLAQITADNTKTTARLSDATDDLSDKYAQQATHLSAAEVETRKHQKSLKDEADAAKLAADALEELNERLSGYFAEARKGSDTMDAYAEALAGATTQTIEIGGRTREQQDALEELERQYRDAEGTIRDYEYGIRGLTLSDDERNEKIAEQYELMGLLAPRIEALKGITGEYTTVTDSGAGATQALKNELYLALEQVDAAPEILAAAGVALGVFSEEEAKAMLKAVLLRDKVEELAQKIKEGMSIDSALIQLQNFQTELMNAGDDANDTEEDINTLQEDIDTLTGTDHSVNFRSEGIPEIMELITNLGTEAERVAGYYDLHFRMIQEGQIPQGGHQPLDTPSPPQGTMPPPPPSGPGGHQGPPGAQHGADFIVPPGFPGDTFPLRVTSGEHVVVTPAGKAGRSMTLNLVLPNYTGDPVAMSEMVINKVGEVYGNRMK